jgi:hypothetical protein
VISADITSSYPSCNASSDSFWIANQVKGILGRQFWFNEVVMNYGNIHSWSVNLDRRIALALRRDPKLIEVFAYRLRSKMTTARSAAAVGNDDWEWYVILALWSPLQVIGLLEDSSEQAARLRKTSPLLSLLSDSERSQLLAESRVYGASLKMSSRQGFVR